MAHSQRLLYRKKQEQTVFKQKLVCFKLGEERYALPIQKVKRIIREFEVDNQSNQEVWLARHEEGVVTILDLSSLSIQRGAIQNANHLVIYLSDNGDFLGIPIMGIPSILEVSEDQFSEIPALYKQRHSAAALQKLIMDAAGGTLFLLNPEKL